jgi:MoxR-like ATPase
MNQDVEVGAGARARRVVEALETVILGQEDVLHQMMVALLARGHVLLEGVPGTAKTLAIRALSRALQLRFGRVQFTPDLMPTDLTGVNVLDELRRDFSFHPGPLFTDLLLADEINRAPAKTQSALLEAMQERQITTDGVSRPLPSGFTVFASQNPLEYEGTYPLPEAQLDRFLLKVLVGYPSEQAERAILDRYAEGFRSEDVDTYRLQPLLDSEQLESLRAEVDAVHVESSVRDYVTRLVRATREHAGLLLGASPRATVALFMAARAEAVLRGRDFVTPDDVKAMALPVLRHRVQLTPEAEVEDRTADELIGVLLETVPSPR